MRRVFELVHFNLNQIGRSQAGFASGGQDPLDPLGCISIELCDIAARPDDLSAVRLVELLELVAVMLFQLTKKPKITCAASWPCVID